MKKIKPRRVNKPQYDSQSNLLFSAVVLTKNVKPNRAGALLRWRNISDVNIDDYKKNPTILYAHNNHVIPIGYGSLEVTKDQVILDGVIPNLSQKKDAQEFDKEVLSNIRGAIAEGLLSAVSAGFYIDEYEATDEGNLEILALSMVEVSVVSIGAHEDAIIAGNSIGGGADGYNIPEIFKSDPVVKEHEKSVGDENFIQYSSNIMYDTDDNNNGDEGTKDKIAFSNSAIIDHDCILIMEDGSKKLEHKHNPADLKETMAKILGARGGIKLEGGHRRKAYEHISDEYTSIIGIEAPKLREYSEDELKALHNDGSIIIPGMCPPMDESEVDEEEGDDEQYADEPIEEKNVTLSEDSFNQLAETMYEVIFESISQKLNAQVKELVETTIENTIENSRNYR